MLKGKKQEQPIVAASGAIDLAAELIDLAPRPDGNTGKLPATTGRLDIYILLALLLAAFGFRLYSLQFFHVIATDGTSYALTARALARGDWHGFATYGFYPLLIAFANWFVGDLEAAGRIVSVVFGSLLVIPLFLMGRALFSRDIAIAATLAIVVWPSMIATSCEVITQATYTTLLLTAVFFIWRAFTSPSLLRGSLAGCFIGLSYLTRPEAIILSVAIPAALYLFSLQNLREKRLFFWPYAVSFALLFTLNLLLVHHVTGQWQLSAKTDSALNDALSYYLNIPDMTYIPGYEPKSYLDIIREHPEFILKNTLINLRKAWNVMLPLPFWVLFITGLFSGGFDRTSNRVRLFLLATFAPLLVLVVFYYIDSNYTVAFLPVMLIIAAQGFALIEDKLKRFLRQTLHFAPAAYLPRVSLLLIATTIYAVTVFTPQIRKDISAADYRPEMDDGRRSEKHIGLLLKHNLPPGKIMTRWARIAFYADREWANVPAGVSFDEIIKAARTAGVRYLIADGMLYGNRPEFGLEIFAPFMNENNPAGLFFNKDQTSLVRGLRPFLIYTDPGSVGVIVYEILPANS